MSTMIANENHANSVESAESVNLDSVMTEVFGKEVRISLPTDRRVIPPVIEMLTDIAENVGSMTERDQMSIGIALEEALTNAVVHGNLEVSSDLRDRDDDSFERAIASRLLKPHFAERRVDLLVRFSDCEATFTIGDEGPGFDVSKIPNPTDNENVFLTHGRGVFLMRSFMDQVTYNEIGNRVTLVKRKLPPN